MDKIDSIFHGDCMELLRSLPSESVDLVVSDPPYLVTARGSAGNSGGMMQKDINKKGKVFEHNSIEIETYLPELYRVLKDGSHCYIMCNHINLVHFLKVIDESDFHFIKCLIWRKMNLIMGTFYMNAFEYIIFLRKGKAVPINDCGRGDIITIPNVKTKKANGENIHDSQKPVSLMQILIEESSQKGDIVLDPFMGSGTTALACIRSGRHFVGAEIDDEYYDLINKRIKEEKKNPQALF